MLNIDELSNGKYEQEVNLLDKKGDVVGSIKVQLIISHKKEKEPIFTESESSSENIET